jgi:imidazolonepropionase-like amidohydrolase
MSQAHGPRSTVFGSSSRPIAVRGVLLPEDEQRNLFVVGGRVTYEPAAHAELVAEGWIVPGLVDAHCHIGLDENGAVPDAVAEQQALTTRDGGALLVRDAGTAADTRWMDDRVDLPRIIRAGRHLARRLAQWRVECQV